MLGSFFAPILIAIEIEWAFDQLNVLEIAKLALVEFLQRSGTVLSAGTDGSLFGP